jgi:hypothetical protein
MWHTLALALGGRTIKEWQSTMSQREFEEWRDFYMRFPFDDLHRYHRPAALIARSFCGGDIGPTIEWLVHPFPAGHTAEDSRTLAAFGLTPQDISSA